MTTENRTPARILADLLIQGGLDEFVRARRATGDSWRDIELALSAATEGKVNVTGQTLRMWYPGLPRDSDGAVA
jgi:hypothetical protein